MLIFRVEHIETKDGPYRSCMDDNDREEFRLLCYTKRFHPQPHTDIPYCPYIGASLKFGFQNRRHLNKWFYKQVRTILKRNDYKIAIYSINKKHIHFGKKQLVFDVDQATFKQYKELR